MASQDLPAAKTAAALDDIIQSLSNMQAAAEASGKKVVTRFAPSPTGYLHIGGARTALFNYLFSKHTNGTFLLRIEDTDRVRSTEAAVAALLDGLTWLGLKWDQPPIFQFARSSRHAEVALELLKAGKAYYCYATPEELEQMRKEQEEAGLPPKYDGRWRDRDPAEAPKGVTGVIRLRMPQEGECIINDAVQGEVKVANSTLDDMVLLRADGTPTYMLAVVVDDHDMGITHIIRGADHLTNAFRQNQLYKAAGWETPTFAHIPLIHGPDGKKLSKRHGATGAEEYAGMGYLPEAMRNYLLRLGWAHGDTEIISTEEAIKIFTLDGIGRSPSRLDFDQLDNLNAHYIRSSDDARLAELATPHLNKMVGKDLTKDQTVQLTKAMPGLKMRAKTIKVLAEAAYFLFRPLPLPLNAAANKELSNNGGRERLAQMKPALEGASTWDAATLESVIRGVADKEKLVKFAQPIRCALTGTTTSPPVFELLELLGKAESLARINNVLANENPVDAPAETESAKAAGKSADLEKARKEKAAAKAQQKAGGAAAQDPYTRLDVRVGKILSIENHPESDKLYVEQVDVGDAEPRTIVSGLREFIPIEEMQGKEVVCVLNLAPRTMVGVKSCGLVLVATAPDGKKVVLAPPQGAKPGDKVTAEGFSGEPDKGTINGKKKVWDAVFPELKTNDGAVATYKGAVLSAAAGPCQAAGAAGGTIQ